MTYRLMYWPIYRPICRSTYWPTYRSSARWQSTDITADMSTDISRLSVGRYVDRHIGRVSVDISVDTSVDMLTDISVEGCTKYTWSQRLNNWSTVWIPVFSGRERHFEIRRIGRDCWPWRLKFHMADASKHATTLDRNIFQGYKLISRNIFNLMFCNSLEQCKVSVGCGCCTRVSRNHLFFHFFPRISGVN